MRKHVIWVVAVTATLAVAAAGVALAKQKEIPTVVRAGNLVLTVNGGFNPTTLPKHRRVPLGFHMSGDLKTVDGTHPPAFREAVFDVDSDVELDVSGFPVCRKGQLEAQSAVHAKQVCAGALLGEGAGSVEVLFPEQAPIDSTGPLLLFNGGERGGAMTLFIHAYVSIPAPTAIVTTITVTREHKGPYGLRFVTKVPVIAAGAGSVTAFELKAERYLTHGGERRSFIFARCSDGRIQGKGRVWFSDETSLGGSLVRPCTATG